MLSETHNILLVDDHQLVVDGLKTLLQEVPHLNIVAEANNGLEALRILKEENLNIHLVIADVNMPTLNGIDLCKAVKKEFTDIKVLILSMYQNQSVVQEALMAEADGYIVKNAGKKEFVTAIYRLLDGSTYFSEAILPIIYKAYQKEQVQQEALSKLTDRELDVLKLIVTELTSNEIADKLCISKKTVDNHRQSLLTKTNSKSTIGLVKYAIKCGIEV